MLQSMIREKEDKKKLLPDKDTLTKYNFNDLYKHPPWPANWIQTSSELDNLICYSTLLARSRQNVGNRQVCIEPKLTFLYWACDCNCSFIGVCAGVSGNVNRRELDSVSNLNTEDIFLRVPTPKFSHWLATALYDSEAPEGETLLTTWPAVTRACDDKRVGQRCAQ